MVFALTAIIITTLTQIGLTIFLIIKTNTMAKKQSELAAEVVAINVELVAVKSTVAKVATETTGLVGKVEAQTKKIEELEAIILAGGEVSQELQDAVDAVKTSSTDIAASVKAVDDLVADAPVEETPTEEPTEPTV